MAQDVASEAIARALERWDDVSQMDSPDGWTFQVAFNVARRRYRRAEMERRLLRRSTTPEVIAGPAGELWLVVAKLPNRQRTAVLLRHVGHLTEPEVAQAMGVSRGTVSSTLRAAYRTLRADLTEPNTLEVGHG